MNLTRQLYEIAGKEVSNCDQLNPLTSLVVFQRSETCACVRFGDRDEKAAVRFGGETSSVQRIAFTYGSRESRSIRSRRSTRRKSGRPVSCCPKQDVRSALYSLGHLGQWNNYSSID